MTFEEYVEKTLAQKKPHHVVLNVVDWLIWRSDEWEEAEDGLGSASGHRVLRRIADGATVRVDVVDETERW